MKIGDCYILRSEFHKIDLGVILFAETKTEYLFTPINFENHKFDFTPSAIFDGKLQTNKVYSGTHNATITGIFAIHENKKKPSFLTHYCKENKPFINLNLNTDNIILGQGSTEKNQIIIGGGGSFPLKKEDFDKMFIHSYAAYSSRDQANLDLILKSK
jgi:hypothetical protein